MRVLFKAKPKPKQMVKAIPSWQGRVEPEPETPVDQTPLYWKVKQFSAEDKITSRELLLIEMAQYNVAKMDDALRGKLRRLIG